MKITHCALYVSAIVLAATGLAVAGEKQSATLEIADKAIWSGKEITPGRYQVAWDGESGNVKVTLTRGHKVVAEGQGRVEQRKEASADSGVLSRRDGSGGTPVISEVHFAKKNTVLVLAGS